MAGDWIKVESVTPDKPEIDMLADMLNTTVNEVLGALVRLWIWADEQTVDGNAASVTKSAIDRHSGVPNFAESLLSPEVSWLIEDENGGFRFPNFTRHNGQTAKRRALTAKRVANHKAKNANAAVTPSALPREEKRREENKKKKQKEKTGWLSFVDVVLPAPLTSGNFRGAWSDWCRYKSQRGDKVTEIGVTRQLTSFAKMGADRASDAIGYTIEQGWMGIQERKTRGGGNGKPAPAGNRRYQE